MLSETGRSGNYATTYMRSLAGRQTHRFKKPGSEIRRWKLFKALALGIKAVLSGQKWKSSIPAGSRPFQGTT